MDLDINYIIIDEDDVRSGGIIYGFSYVYN